MHRGSEGVAGSLARGSPEPLLTLSPSGRVLSWSRRAELAFGYTRAEAIGRPLLTLVVPPDGVETVQRAIVDALAGHDVRCHELRRRKDGTLLEPLEARFELRGEGGAASLVVIVGQPAASAVAELPAPPPAPAADPAPPTPVRAEDTLWRDATQALSGAFAPSVMLQRLVVTLVPRFVDWAAADLLEGGVSPRRVAAAHREPELGRLLGEAALSASDAPPLSPLRVLRNAQPILEPQPVAGDVPEEALRRLGHGAHLVLPLLGRTRILGALTLVRAQQRSFTPDDVAWSMELTRRAALELENAMLVDQVQRMRESARHATDRARHLHALSSALSEALTPAQVTEEAVRLARETMGACGGAVAMLSPDHTTFEVTSLVGEARPLSNARLRIPVHASTPLSDAGRSGDPVLLEQIIRGAPRYPFLAGSDLAHGALAAVPLVVDGRHVGALGLVFPERRSFSVEDVDFMRVLARHAADALERARLYGAERSARAQADAEARRNAFLADASRILSSSFDYRATLEAAARLCVPTFADWAAVYLREKDGSVRAVAVVHSDPRKATLARELLARPAEPPGLLKVLETGHPEVFDDLPERMLAATVQDEGARRAFAELGLRSQVVLPLVARGRTVGALTLCNGTHRRLPLPDLHLVEELARRAALAVDNARLYHEVEDAYRRKEESMVALRESEERYRLLVDGAPDYALFLLDPEGRVQSWNAAAERLLGYTAQEIIGQTTHVFYLPEDIEAKIPERELEVARAEGRCEMEAWRVRKDGSRYWASVIVTALRDESGDVRGFSKLHRDITERKLAREELDLARQRIAQHEKLSTMGTLVSGVAHEIRTPLTAIANSIHLVRMLADRGAVAPEVIQRHTALALEGVDRINALVQDLRKFKRLDAGAGRAVASLDGVVEEALTLFRAAHRGRVEVDAELEATPPVEVDRAQLQQVVLNLLQNASDAMPHGGSVELRTGATAEGAAFLSVRDHGVGMTPEVRSRMFEEFFTTKPEGTGLGLSIVRRIIEMHHGRIDCDSEPGRGTTFTITLPAKA